MAKNPSVNRRSAMPAFTDKVLTDQELTDIYAYLKSFQAPKTTAIPLLDSLREK